MNKFDVSAVNKINLSALYGKDNPVAILWIMASAAENKDTLNRRFHHHAFYEMHFIASGYIDYALNGKEVRVNRGEYILFAPQQSHKVSGYSSDFSKFSVAYEIDAVKTPGLSQFCGFVRKIDSDAAFMLDMICRRAALKRGFEKEAIYASLQSIIYISVGKWLKTSENGTSDNTSDDRLVKAKKYIEDNYDTFFCCEDVAEYCHLSTKQLSRLFSHYEGVSLSEFIRKVKIEQAKRMLIRTAHSQGEISRALGFSSVNYFNTFFTKYAKMTPDEFRTSCAKENSDDILVSP